jgi:hypothetical protein
VKEGYKEEGRSKNKTLLKKKKLLGLIKPAKSVKTMPYITDLYLLEISNSLAYSFYL